MRGAPRSFAGDVRFRLLVENFSKSHLSLLLGSISCRLSGNELSSMHFCPHSVHDAFAIWVDSTFGCSSRPPKSRVTIFSLLLRCRRRLGRDMKWRETCHPLGPPSPRYPITLLSSVASQRCFPRPRFHNTHKNSAGVRLRWRGPNCRQRQKLSPGRHRGDEKKRERVPLEPPISKFAARTSIN